MTAGLDQIDRLLNVPFDAVLSASVEDHEKQLLDLNRKQLDKGLDSEGRDIGQYSSIRYKGRRRPVDLLDTGAFRGSFNIDSVSGAFVVDATDSKTEKLEKKYGPDIVGVPRDDYDTMGELLATDLIDALRNAL